MKYSLKKMSVLLAVAALGTAVHAQVNEASRVSFLSEQVGRQAAQAQVAQQTPLQKYQAKLMEIKHPETETAAVLDALRELTAYNKRLSREVAARSMDAGQKMIEPKYMPSTIVKDLLAPAPVGWNDYRGYPLVEVIDRYVPDNHGDAQIAELEYKVKTLLCPVFNIYEDALKQVHPSLLLGFMDMYTTVREMKIKDPKQIVRQLVKLSRAYNEYYAQDRAGALRVKANLFELPLRTGWDRTVTIRGLYQAYALYEISEGYILRDVEDLTERYGISEQEAKELNEYLVRRNEK